MITLTGEDRNIAARMTAVSPSVSAGPSAWKMGDSLPAGDDIATATVGVGPGFAGSLSMDLVSPASSTGTSSVKMFRRYLDRDGNLLSQADSAAVSVIAGTPTTAVLTLSAAPAGTASCVVGLYSNMAPPGDPTRYNEFLDPRCTTTAGVWFARNSWSLSAVTGQTGLPAGVTTAAQVQAVSAGAATNSGFDMYTAVGAPNPAGVGAPAVPGATMTFSVYVYSTKAGTMVLQVRPFAGTTWSAASTDTTAAIVANTWTRYSVTLTVPAGATQLAATLRMSTSVTWAVGDQIRVSSVLLEESGSAGLYFDGTAQDSGIAAPKSSRWESATNASRSIFYAATKAGGTTVQAEDSVLSYSASAEELVGAALERDMRRSVADLWNASQALVTAGTAGLLAGQLTFLCESLAQALAVDAVYRMTGLITLGSSDELDGLTHRAVGRARMNPERPLPGRASKWLYVTDFREQVR